VRFAIYTPGLSAFNADLSFFENGVSRSLQPALRRFAERFGERVRARYAGRHATSRSVNAGGIRGTATGRVAKLVLDGDRYPFLSGQNFGSSKYAQFPAWAGKDEFGGNSDYFFFRTIGEELPNFTGDLADIVDAHMARAFPAGGVLNARGLTARRNHVRAIARRRAA